MKFNFIGDISEINKGLELLIQKRGFQLNGDGIIVEVKKRTGTLEVKKEGEKLSIKYQEKIHFFRALGLLLENLNTENDFCITETPKFKTNGIMVDASRNAVMNIQSIKTMLEFMAIMGLNMMMLYTEDTYEIQSIPYFGYMRGRYTHEELSECDQYAEFFGIEMVPCIQTLAHLFAAIKWNYADDIKDTEDILLVGHEKTYEFIEEMIKSASAPFRSKRIHIGMDEAHNLGLGRYLTENGYKSRFDIMNEHLSKVREITSKYDLKPIIWSDMYYRLGSKTGDYYDLKADIPEDIIADIPKDVQLVYWDYYHHDKEFYKQMIVNHKKLCSNTVFAGGIWTWNGMTINYDKTFITTNAGLQACKEEKIDEVFATMWGDNGAETNIFSALLGMQLYAEHGYSDEVSNEKLKKRFKFCTGGDDEAFFNLSKLDSIPDNQIIDREPPSNPSKFLLWQDVLIGLFDKHIEGKNLSTYYENLTEKLNIYAQSAGEWHFVFDVPLATASVLSLKCNIGIEIKKCYDNRDLESLQRYVQEFLPKLNDEVCALRETHRKQWLKTYKSFGWEVIDMRYGGLMARIDTAKYRLTQYLSNEIFRIEELEEEKLFFDGVELSKRVNIGYCNHYHRIVSASPLGFNG